MSGEFSTKRLCISARRCFRLSSSSSSTRILKSSSILLCRGLGLICFARRSFCKSISLSLLRFSCSLFCFWRRIRGASSLCLACCSVASLRLRSFSSTMAAIASASALSACLLRSRRFSDSFRYFTVRAFIFFARRSSIYFVRSSCSSSS